MSSFLDPLRELIPVEKAVDFGVALAMMLLGYGLATLARRSLVRLGGRSLTPQHAMIAGRAAFVLIFFISFTTALDQAGVDLSVALGAAGLMTVAVGFAAQTSTSNLISGLFLMVEKPFVIGDSIQVGSTTGEVIAIDPLSVKLRTFDNLFVRLPNEGLLKSEIINLTRFPIRRLDLALDIAYASDLEHARRVLDAIAQAEILCLDEPRPQFAVQSFAESTIKLRYSTWTATANYLELKTRLLIAIKKTFTREGIELSVPSLSVWTMPPALGEGREAVLGEGVAPDDAPREPKSAAPPAAAPPASGR